MAATAVCAASPTASNRAGVAENCMRASLRVRSIVAIGGALDTGGGRVDEEDRRAVGRAGGHEQGVGHGAVEDEGLVAVERPVVLAAGGGQGDVLEPPRSGVLGQRDGRHAVAAGDARQQLAAEGVVAQRLDERCRP